MAGVLFSKPDVHSYYAVQLDVGRQRNDGSWTLGHDGGCHRNLLQSRKSGRQCHHYAGIVAGSGATSITWPVVIITISPRSAPATAR